MMPATLCPPGISYSPSGAGRHAGEINLTSGRLVISGDIGEAVDQSVSKLGRAGALTVTPAGRIDPNPERGTWQRDPPAVAALIILTIVAGAVDAIAFLHLGGVFISNQTGNLLLVAMATTGMNVVDVGAALASFFGFFVGAAVAGRWLTTTPAGRHRPPRSTTLLLVVLLLLLVGAALVIIDTGAPGMVVIPLAPAMGMQAALAVRLGVRFLTTGFVTGSTVTMSVTSPLGDRTDRGWWHGIVPLAAICLGAVVSAVVSSYSVALAVIAVAGLVAMAAWFTTRPEPQG
jgi:uncharacterized membrane protein YoaK (UPF0700 family)